MGAAMENLLVITLAMSVFTASCLWVGMILMGVEGTFFTAMGIVIISSVFLLVIPMSSFIPGGNWLTAPIVQLAMICWLTHADIWPQAVVTVGFAQVGSIVGALLLAGILGQSLIPV